MFTATFIFRVHNADADFDQFNIAIDAAARQNPGFVRREGWASDDGQTRAVVYYWESLEALDEFSNLPVHTEAKRRYREWYEGYEVIVSEIVRRKGDGRLDA